MAEEKVVEEKVVNDEGLAKLVMGSDNRATSEVMGHKFSFHYPGILEGLKIQSIARNLRKETEKDDDPDLRFQTIILATLDVLCDEIAKVGEKPEIITIKDGLGNSVRKMKFMEFVDELKKPNLWIELIFPLYESFMRFSNSVLLKDQELKN